MRGWAARLGLRLGGGETHRGRAVEDAAEAELRATGLSVERQTARAPFDLLVGGVRVDVKSARHGVYRNRRAGGSCAGFVFALNKVPPTCDLYLLCGVDEGNAILWRYYVPAEVAHVRTITITPAGKYSGFKENVGQLHRLIAMRAGK